MQGKYQQHIDYLCSQEQYVQEARLIYIQGLPKGLLQEYLKVYPNRLSSHEEEGSHMNKNAD